MLHHKWNLNANQNMIKCDQLVYWITNHTIMSFQYGYMENIFTLKKSSMRQTTEALQFTQLYKGLLWRKMWIEETQTQQVNHCWLANSSKFHPKEDLVEVEQTVWKAHHCTGSQVLISSILAIEVASVINILDSVPLPQTEGDLRALAVGSNLPSCH